MSVRRALAASKKKDCYFVLQPAELIPRVKLLVSLLLRENVLQRPPRFFVSVAKPTIASSRWICFCSNRQEKKLLCLWWSLFLDRSLLLDEKSAQLRSFNPFAPPLTPNVYILIGFYHFFVLIRFEMESFSNFLATVWQFKRTLIFQMKI